MYGKPRYALIKDVNRHNSLLVMAVVLTGFVLRLINIGGKGIWYDDAFSILLANREIPQIISGTAADTMPPVYYFLLHFWGLVSQQIWFLRILNVILSTVVIYLIIKIVSRIANSKAALVAGMLTAISPFQIYHAQELRMYVILEFALLIHILAFVDLFVITNLNGIGKWKAVGLVLSGIVALYSHNLAVFTLAGLNIFLIVRRDWRSFSRNLLLQSIMLFAFLPWLVFLPGQIDKIQTAFWTPKPGLVQIIQSVLTMLGTLPLTQLSMYSIAILVTFLLVIILRRLSLSDLRRTNMLFVICLVFAPPFLLFVVSWFMRPIFVPRAFIVSGLFIYAFVGIILGGRNVSNETIEQNRMRTMKSKSQTIIIMVIFAIISAISLPFQYTYSSFPRSEFSQLIKIVGEGCTEDCLVVHDNKLSYFPALIYGPNVPQVFIMDEKGSHNDTLALKTQQAMGIFAEPDIQTAVGNKKMVRFVVFSKTISEYRDMGIAIHPNLEWLRGELIEKEHRSIGDLEFFFFEKSQ
jgi:hypothetical protein